MLAWEGASIPPAVPGARGRLVPPSVSACRLTPAAPGSGPRPGCEDQDDQRDVRWAYRLVARTSECAIL
jgi:hypothetical protein